MILLPLLPKCLDHTVHDAQFGLPFLPVPSPLLSLLFFPFPPPPAILPAFLFLSFSLPFLIIHLLTYIVVRVYCK